MFDSKRSGARSVPLSHRDLALIADSASAHVKLQRVIELAIDRSGSQAALARALDVTPATVCQWKARRKNPDAINLIRMQDLAHRPARKPRRS